MCGICGVVNTDGAPVSASVLRAMTDTLRHRGPEASRVHVDETVPGVGLGHTRLRILDLREVADQPMASDDGSVLLTFNGEIYNHRELRETLRAGGATFRTTSDTEVLLRLYESKGAAAVSEIDGMFAFAVWDARRARLVLGRDRAGKKPLYYATTARLFAFASEIKALLKHPELSPDIDTAALPQFFLYGYAPSPLTLYRGIRQVPPGHVLVVGTDGRLTLSQYWDVPLEAPESGAEWTEEAAAAELRRRLAAAVERRLIADVPLGAFLSGGLDSSVVVALMAGQGGEPVRTFSIGFADAPAYDETGYAEAVARKFGTRHTTFVVEPSAVELIERLVWHHDGPFADSSAVPTYLLASLARQHVTVALNGDGGDELFAGYLRFYAALVAERVPSWAWRLAARAAALLPDVGTHRSPLRRLKRFAGSAALPFARRLTRWAGVFYEDLSRLLPHAVDGFEPAGLEALLARSRHVSDLNRLLYLNFKTYLLDDLLVKMDRCSMAHALEARSPFLDTAVVEFAFRLPDRFRLRGRQTKYLLRRAFADLLPPEILTRGKMGFGVPLQQWFRSDLRDYLGDHLLASLPRLASYVDHRYVRRLCEEHVAGAADHSHRLWTLLTFEVWLRELPAWAAVSDPVPG
jgi:asparagine synthase (glutamine-hydrolysing)